MPSAAGFTGTAWRRRAPPRPITPTGITTVSPLVCRREAEKDAAAEPLLSSFLYASILSHDNFERSLAFVLSNRLSDATFLSTELFEVFYSILRTKPEIAEAALADIRAVRERVGPLSPRWLA